MSKKCSNIIKTNNSLIIDGVTQKSEDTFEIPNFFFKDSCEHWIQNKSKYLNFYPNLKCPKKTVAWKEHGADSCSEFRVINDDKQHEDNSKFVPGQSEDE